MSVKSRSHSSKKHTGEDGGRRKAEEGAGRSRFDWSRVSVPAKRDFVEYVYDKVVNFEDPDVRVVAGDLEFNCHAVVLRSYSGFFREHAAPSVALPPAAASSAAFSAIYDWMLADGGDARSVLSRDNVVDVLASARHLRVPDLARLCERLLAEESLFPEYAAFRVMVEAGRREGLEDIRDAMLPRISHSFLSIIATEDFIHLSVDEMCRLLSSSNIAVHGELEVVFAAALWLTADWDARRGHVVRAMRCARFGLVPARQLLALRHAYRQAELRELVAPLEVQEMLSDGLSYSALRGSADQAGLDEVARSLGCRPQRPRAALADGDACPATFREFVDAVEARRPSPAFLRRQSERRSLPLYQRPACLPRNTTGCFVCSGAPTGDIAAAPRQAGADYTEDSASKSMDHRLVNTSARNDCMVIVSSAASGSTTDAFSSSSCLLMANVSTQTPFPLVDDEDDDAVAECVRS